MRKVLTILLFSALCLSAADLTGKWEGKAEGGLKINGPFTLQLKQNGENVTGTCCSARQNPIRNGKVRDQKVTFEMVIGLAPDGVSERVAQYTLTLSGDKLAGEGTYPNEHGAQQSMKVTLARAK